MNNIGIIQPNMLAVLRAYLVSCTTVVAAVDQRVFTHSIPKTYAGTDCIVIESLPGLGSDPDMPITDLSFSFKCFSKDKSTALEIERTGLFPNLHGYDIFIDGEELSFPLDFPIDFSRAWMSAVQSQSSILVQDTDYVGEYWYSESEYNITLRY